MHPRSTLPALGTLLIALLLTGCASQVPLLIRQGPADSPTPAEVRVHPDAYRGRAVRWGGLLLATGNLARATRLTVLARPLTRDGEPALGDASLGRFIAIVPGFLDPQVYTADRLVTVTGIVTGSESGPVGDHAYVYPVVEAQAWYLWPEPAPPYGAPDPWWYDPWYGPWWYGSWYDPWYYPGYYPRWYPHHLHPHKRDRHGTAVPRDTWPAPHRPRHPHTEPRRPRVPSPSGPVPSPGHDATPPRPDRPGARPRPDAHTPREQPAAGTAPPHETGAAAPRKTRTPERHRPEAHDSRTRPEAGAERRQEQHREHGQERSAPEPAPASAPARERGFRGLFRRDRDD